MPISKRKDLKDWAMTVELGKECCLSAQRNGADVVAKSVLSIVGQMLEAALNPKDNRFLYLSFAPLAVGRAGVALNPVITASRVAIPPQVLPGALLLAVGLELGNVYGRTVLLNAMGDMTSAVTQTLEQAEREIRKPKTGRGTKRGIFDCDKCVREKALPQHGSRLAVDPVEGRTGEPPPKP